MKVKKGIELKLLPGTSSRTKQMCRLTYANEHTYTSIALRNTSIKYFEVSVRTVPGTYFR